MTGQEPVGEDEDPFEERRYQRRISVATYLMASLVVFGVMASPPVCHGFDLPLGRWIGFFPNIHYQGIAPAVAIIAALAMLAMASAFLRIFLPLWGRVAAFVLLVLLVTVNNNDPFCFRFENMAYGKPRDLPKEVETLYPTDIGARNPDAPDLPASTMADECEPLLKNDVTLKAWRNHCQTAPGSGSDPSNPRLVIVCTSGGAIRAGYWTATVLDRLGGKIPNFHRHVRIITGASGGIVGASYYVTWLRDRLAPQDAVPEAGPLPKFGWIRLIPIESLRAVARSLALRESLLAGSRLVVNLFGAYPDRGVNLEKDWVALRYPLSKLRPFEEKGELPSLIISPMTVEDGRRLLISNLDLSVLDEPKGPPPRPSPTNLLALTRGSMLAPDRGPEKLSPMSLTGIEYFKVFCPRGPNDLMLSTAARISATFPYVSPAVNLPTNPPLRVVDAGYYDNYGVDVAAAWIFANRIWIEKNTSGVLIVQIRDALSVADRFGYSPEDEGWYASIFRGLQFFSSPIDAVSRARYSSSAFRNDALVAGLSDYFSEKTGKREFLTTAVFELASRTVQPIRGPVWEWPGDGLDQKIAYADSSQSTEVAMSWYLTVAERQAIDMAIPTERRPEGFGNPVDCLCGEGTRSEALAKVIGIKDAPAGAFEVQAINPIANDEFDGKELMARVNRLKTLRRDLAERMKTNPRIPKQALYVLDKELARAENFERLQRLDRWWKQ